MALRTHGAANGINGVRKAINLYGPTFENARNMVDRSLLTAIWQNVLSLPLVFIIVLSLYCHEYYKYGIFILYPAMQLTDRPKAVL